MFLACFTVNLYAACVAEIHDNILCQPGDRATIPSETGRYRQCMNKRVLTGPGNSLSAAYYTCGGGAWVYLSDHEYVCEVAAKNDCN